mmetsp:Transcript_101433/g.282321  ORF Transcript_101433/g.282321 Transcript_101433/m.282321 type:complete len:200 (+) Transcript_101433:487-1086(+)
MAVDRCLGGTWISPSMPQMMAGQMQADLHLQLRSRLPCGRSAAFDHASPGSAKTSPTPTSLTLTCLRGLPPRAATLRICAAMHGREDLGSEAGAVARAEAAMRWHGRPRWRTTADRQTALQGPASSICPDQAQRRADDRPTSHKVCNRGTIGPQLGPVARTPTSLVPNKLWCHTWSATAAQSQFLHSNQNRKSSPRQWL